MSWRRRVAAALAAALVAAGCSGGGDDGGVAAKGGKDTGKPSHPKQWDPRVAELADFVEAERDLRFKHPVHVDFLDAAAFRKEVTQDREDLTDDEKDELEALEGLGRAIGLISGDFDLLDAGNDLAGDGVLAFYESETKRVTVKGSDDLTVSVRATLVHELTHALQDQHFDLGRLGELETDGADSAFQAVVEGDATRIENLWVKELSEEDQAAYEEQSAAVAGEAEAGLADVPEWLRALFGAPYALGLPFVEAVVADGGSKALDRAFKTPPVSEEQVVNPGRYLTRDVPAKVAAPKPGAGQKKVDQSDFGLLGWVVVLAERLPATEVIKAIDGWDGDAFLSFTENGRTCVQVRVVGDGDSETADFAEVLESWVDGLGDATAERDGRFAVLNSCEPRAGQSPAPPGADPVGAETILGRLATRSTLFAGTLGQGASAADAECYAATFVGDLSDEDLTAAEATPELEALATKAAQACFTQ